MLYTLTRNPDILTLQGALPNTVRLVYTGTYTADMLDTSAEQLVAYYAAALILDNFAQNTADVAVRNGYTSLAQQYRAAYNQATDTGCGQFATPAEMLKRFDAKELAQLCRVPSSVLFAQVIQQQIAIPSDFTPAEIAQAKAALKTLCQACIDADSYALAALTRYSTIPGPIKPLIINCACDIARYYLYDSGSLEDNSVVQRRHERATQLLDRITQGALQIGIPQREAFMVNTPRRGSW